MSQERLKYLFERHLAKSATAAEKEELAALSLETENSELVKVLIQQSWEITGTGDDMPEEKSVLLLNTILHPEKETISFQQENVRPISWRRIAVAASIILAIGIGSYFFFFTASPKPKEIVQAPLSKDVEAPKITKATIILSDGRRVSVDSITQLTQNNVALTKTTDGNLVYSGKASEVAYNTVNNPRGSKVVDMTLADGTHFWLNAGSSITYPLSFIGNERKVSITGEAYFEVKHNDKMPFTVSANGVDVHDIGTAFNINAYDDEPNIKVTLLEGSVRVSRTTDNGQQSTVIKPGEQAEIDPIHHSPFTIHQPDLNEVMAWKNGKFLFEKADLKSIMRQIEKWYDVEVTYTADVKDKFHLEMSRATNVSNAFRILEETGAIHFKIEGRTVTVIK